MNCNEVIDKLNSYLDDELSATEIKIVEGHLSACNKCARELESIQELNSILTLVPSMPVPFGFVKETVRKAVSQRERQYSFADWWRGITFSWKAAACAAALAGLLVGGFIAKSPFRQTQMVAGAGKILFFDNETSLDNSYTTALLVRDGRQR